MTCYPRQPMPRLTRPLLLLCALAGSKVGSAADTSAADTSAADIVLPDFTPATMDDFAAASDLGSLARMALEDRGLTVLAGEDLADRVGDAADACADEVACPVSLWGQVDATTAVVGRVGHDRGLLEIRVLVYENQGSRATRTYDELLPPSAAGELMLQIADDLAPLVGAPPNVRRVDSGIVEEHYEPIGSGRTGGDRELDEPLDDQPRRPDGASDRQIAALKLPAYAVRRYEDSGQAAEHWLEDARVRRPGVFLELHGGAVFGDLDRRYDTRIGLYDEEGNAWSERDAYTYHSFLNGLGFTGGAAIGYQFAWWVDMSILGGLQLGHKELTTGWETWEANGEPDGSDRFLDSDETVYDPVSAVLAFMEPRVRLYPVALGPLKPYGLAGFNLRFYDAYTVPDEATVDYLEATGGVTLGPTLGGGLAFDAPKGAIGFIEIPWTYVVSPAGATVVDSGGLQTVPVQFTGVAQYIAFKAGLGVHFH